MTASLLGAVLALGLAGSLHCPLMCGPLAVAGCRRGGRSVLAYLGGRLVSYAALGAVFGTVGEHALCLLPMEKVQVVAMVLVGGFAVWRGVSALRRPRPVTIRRGPPRRLSRLVALMPRRGLGLGLATGFLPCGMLVPAWLLAATSGDAVSGALAMALFSAATAPALLLPVVTGAFVRRISPRVQAAAWCALGVWIALRPVFMAAHHHG